jgi:hypothetical protein
MPKRLLKILEVFPVDQGAGEKTGDFLLTLKEPLKWQDCGYIQSYGDVISIIAIEAPVEVKQN